MVRLRVTLLASSCAALAACATGSSTQTGEEGGGGAGTTTSSSSSSGGSGGGGGGGSGGGAGGAGGSGGQAGSVPVCNPPEHLCGGVCAGNTPQTGCYTSSACTPCAPVQNGTTNCTAAGTCDFICASPYAKSGTQCVCPTECCVAADCGSNPCEGGVCKIPCNALGCAIGCAAQGYATGMCLTEYTCTCIG